MEIYYDKDGMFYKGFRVEGIQAESILEKFGITGDFIQLSGDFHNKKLIILNKDEVVVVYLVKDNKERYNLNRTYVPSNTLYLKLLERLCEIADIQEECRGGI